ncbi:MAG: hypothetical protein GY953_46905, partial [bacterium]|nr:hypothetical protein [bacterium]
VVCGIEDVKIQALCNFINHALGNYGRTLDLTRPSFQKQGKEAELSRLREELSAGQIEALFIHGVNPVFELQDGKEFARAIEAALARTT